MTSGPSSAARASASADQSAHRGSSVVRSRITQASTRVDGACTTDSSVLATQQFHDLVGAHAAGAPATQIRRQAASRRVIPLGADDAGGIPVYDEAHLVALVQSKLLADVDRYGHLPLGRDAHESTPGTSKDSYW